MPPHKRARQGRREATYLRPHRSPEAGAWLEAAWHKSPLRSKREVLAAIEYEGGTNRFTDHLKGITLPSRQTLRRYCEAFDASYLEAVAHFGYYREFINALDDLVWLGEHSLEEADARGGTSRAGGTTASRLQSLRDMGVIRWKDEPITWGQPIPWSGKPGFNPSTSDKFSRRYVTASWRELEHQVVRVSYPAIEIQPGGTTTLTFPKVLDSLISHRIEKRSSNPRELIW